MKRLFWSALAALLLIAPAIANADDGYVTGNVNMRAGPDSGYPLIAALPAGTPVAVQGCTTDWAWCDVIAYNSRGWVAGNFIQYDYQGQPVLLPNYAARIGIPIVSFVISSYWDAHYRSRPFYSQRTTWYHRPVPHRPPPRPLYAKPRPVHAAPARPAPRPQSRPSTNHAPQARPPTNHAPQARPSTNHAPQARPPTNHAPQARPPTNHAPQARPPQHAQPGKPHAPHTTSAKAPHGKPAPSKKTDDQNQQH